ncbi:MAG TPA: hypothetical protein VKA18_06365 [Alphaproteobacteria bacterium]|nr:hypothetical protein [Alphaproteobacteria bacterium]
MAYESDHLERTALAELHQAARPDMISFLRLSTAQVGSALLSMAPGMPASAIVINRAIGAGLTEPETPETVRDMVETYREAGVPYYFIHRHPEAQPAEMVEWLREQGLEKARGWQKFRRGQEPVPEVETDLRVEKIGPEHRLAFAHLVCAAFDLGEVAEGWLEALPECPNWHAFMSFDGDEPVGAGAVFILGGLAWTDFGATAPTHRQRGSQSAVLAARIRFALDQGCREIFTCTGEEVAGDPQHSYKNILKLGFREDYLRENYAPPRQ